MVGHRTAAFRDEPGDSQLLVRWQFFNLLNHFNGAHPTIIRRNLALASQLAALSGQTHLNLAQKLHDKVILLPMAKGSPGVI
jgi:hypothetical protein